MRKQDEAIRRLEDLIPDPVTNENLPVFHALCEAIRCVEIVHQADSVKQAMQKRPERIREQCTSKNGNHRNHPIVKKLSAAVRSLFD